MIHSTLHVESEAHYRFPIYSILPPSPRTSLPHPLRPKVRGNRLDRNVNPGQSSFFISSTAQNSAHSSQPSIAVCVCAKTERNGPQIKLSFRYPFNDHRFVAHLVSARLLRSRHSLFFLSLPPSPNNKTTTESLLQTPLFYSTAIPLLLN
jgi:hypothetical protein